MMKLHQEPKPSRQQEEKVCRESQESEESIFEIRTTFISSFRLKRINPFPSRLSRASGSLCSGSEQEKGIPRRPGGLCRDDGWGQRFLYVPLTFNRHFERLRSEKSLSPTGLKFLHRPGKHVAMRRRHPCVYIMGSDSGTLYVGVTSDIEARVADHKAGLVPGFTATNGCHKLLWYENHPDMLTAIAREKKVKRYRREKKVALITAENPGWRDIAEDWGK